MTSTFHTAPDLDPVHFEAAGLHCTKISVGTMDNNAYLLDSGAGPLVLIDAPTSSRRLLELIGQRTLGAVITTHRHADHVQALAQVCQVTGARAYAGAPDADSIAEQTGVVSQPLWTGDQVSCGDISLDVIGLVGHTPGSIALVVRGQPTHIFTGDSLFPGGPGRTTNPSEFTSLIDDLAAQVFDAFDDATVIHPGHGDSTSLGVERPHLPQWRARGW